MLTLNVLPICKARGIERPYTFLKKAGLSHHVIMNITDGVVRAIKLDNLETLCRVLCCEPADIIHWIPDNKHVVPPDHPLYKLRKTESPADLKNILASMPLDQLKQLTDSITAAKKTDS